MIKNCYICRNRKVCKVIEEREDLSKHCDFCYPTEEAEMRETDAYKLGRADQKEEDNEFFNFEGAWELEKKKVRADAINNFVINAITEFQKFDKEHGYPTLGDISVILSDVAEQLKEEK